MADLVSQHRLDLILLHVAKQSGADGHQRVVPAHAGGKGIGFGRIKYSHLRHADTGGTRLALHRIEQPHF